MDPKQLRTIALGRPATPRAFSRILFRLEVQPMSGPEGDILQKYHPDALSHLAIMIGIEGMVAT